MRSFWIALAMYSKLPAKRVEWDKKSLSWALCWFPAVGVAAGALLFFWLWLAGGILGLGTPLRAAVALLIPIAVSGGIHVDGFCDTADALGSHQTREKKLEILKDSHTGAFAVFCCGVYLILFFAAWCQVETVSFETMGVLALMPVLSRSLSGIAAVTMPNARGSGLLATFTAPWTGRRPTAYWWRGCACPYGHGGAGPLGRRRCGGGGCHQLYLLRCDVQPAVRRITGDLEGFFLQICECAMVLGAAGPAGGGAVVRLIIGGAGQGKLDYALKKTGADPAAVALDPAQRGDKAILYHLEAWVKANPAADHLSALEELLAVNPGVVILCDEVGCAWCPSPGRSGPGGRRWAVSAAPWPGGRTPWSGCSAAFP